MNLLQIYRDYGVRYVTEGHKHAREGWVNVACPFCTGHDGYHLGATLDGTIFSCYRCGGKHPKQALSRVLRITSYEVDKLLQSYGEVPRSKLEKKNKIRTKAFKYPNNTGPLQENHIRYLEKRHFDPEQIQREWGILGTGVIAMLDDVNYSHRIIIPYMHNEEIVSFQSRDITDKHKSKYMACMEKREIEHHKHILYGAEMQDTGIIVEGPTDVWRFGPNAYATSGIKYTPKQVRLIAKMKKVFVVFDPEIQAQEQAKKLVAELKFRGCKAQNVLIQDSDPGSMNQSDANYLVNSLLKNSY